MKHFENNVNDGMSRTDSIETLIDLTSCIAVNALMVAGAKGYQVVNENTNRELVEQARRKEAEQAAKHVMSIIFGVKKED